MGVQNLTPGIKPIHWPVDRTLVAPQYQSFWNDLVDIILFDEKGGNPRTLLTGLELVRLDISWETQRSGAGLESSSANERANATSLAAHRISLPITLAVYLHQIGATPSYTVQFGVSANNADAGPQWGYMIGGTNTDRPQLTTNDGDFAYAAVSSTVFWNDYAGQDVLAIGTILNNDLKLFIDGVVVATDASTVAPQYLSTSQVEFGSQTSTSGRYSNSHFYISYIWNRILTTDEMVLLQVDPFGPIRPDLRVIGKALAAITAALTGTTVPTVTEAEMVAG